MKRILTTSLVSFSLSLPAFAMNLPDYTIGAYGGYGNLSGAVKQDGQMVQGRLALGVNGAEYYSAIVGGELGVESGNNIRLQANPNLIATAGGLPLQASLKTMADFLLTLKLRFSDHYPVLGIVKGGIAYRQLQLNNRDSSRDSLQKVSPELQLGLGISVSDHATISAFYQGIYSGNTAGAQLTSNNDVTIRQIPTQQALFLGVDYSFGGEPAPAVIVVPSRSVPAQHMESIKPVMQQTVGYNTRSSHPVRTVDNFATFKPVHQLSGVKVNAIASQTTFEKAAVMAVHPTTPHAQPKLATKTTTKKIKKAATPKVAENKSAKKKLAQSKQKSTSRTLAQATHAKSTKPVIASKSKSSAPAPTKLDDTKTLAQSDNIVIDKPALNFDLMSETVVEENHQPAPQTKTAERDSREVMV